MPKKNSGSTGQGHGTQVDNGVTCGNCMALVLAEKYGGRCDQYCETGWCVGRFLVGDNLWIIRLDNIGTCFFFQKYGEKSYQVTETLQRGSSTSNKESFGQVCIMAAEEQEENCEVGFKKHDIARLLFTPAMAFGLSGLSMVLSFLPREIWFFQRQVSLHDQRIPSDLGGFRKNHMQKTLSRSKS